MAYARKTNENEVVQLRDEITSEVNTDAEHLASSIFGKQGSQPDMARMDNEQIDALYRAAYQRQDRTFLQAEARRDPGQFLKVVERLGVHLPAPEPPAAPPGPVPLPMPAAPPQLAAPLPVGPPAPVVQAGPPTVPPVPVQPVAPSVPPVAPVF